MKYSKRFLIIGIVAVIIILVIIGFYLNNRTSGQYDNFAKCISNEEVKIYGAYWCPHCINQKKMFGASWKYINYTECSLPNREGQTSICKEAGIKAYPTWEFQGGERVEGELSLKELSQYTNCPVE